MAENEIEVYEAQATDVLAQANALEVVDQDSYNVAGAYVKSIKPLEKGILAWFKPLKQKAKAVHQEVCDKESEALKPVRAAIKLFNSKMIKYRTDIEREQREREEALRRESIRLQEEEKLRKAEELAEQGKQAEAEKVLEQEIIEPVFKTPEIPKPKGISYRDNWKWEVIDPDKLPEKYWMRIVNGDMIAGEVKANKDKTQIPGVKVYNDRIQVVG
jgi:hypothetical protein